MKLTQMVVLTLLTSSTVTYGQINRTIDGYGPVVNPHTSQIQRPFIGKFEFEVIPGALRPVTVDFVLEVAHDKHVTEGDWEVVVLYDPRGMKLVSDSSWFWPEPHEVGDKFTGSMTLILLASGPFYFTVQLPGNRRDGLVVQWCLDGDGALQYLGKYEDNLSCYEPYSSFFEGDTITLYSNAAVSYSLERQLFDYSVVVTPPFRIGDTSTVTYYLEALRSLDDQPTIEVTTKGMKVVSDPIRLAYPINVSDRRVWEIKVVPLAVRDRHSLIVMFDDRNELGLAPQNHETIIHVGSVFNNDGSLRLVGNMSHACDKYLPDGFRPLTEGDSEMIILRPNETKTKRYEY